MYAAFYHSSKDKRKMEVKAKTIYFYEHKSFPTYLISLGISVGIVVVFFTIAFIKNGCNCECCTLWFYRRSYRACNQFDINSSSPPIAFELVSESYTEMCIICLERFAVEDTVRKLKCGHVFHKNCIDEWFVSHRSCCLCKKNIIGMTIVFPPPSTSRMSSIRDFISPRF